MNITRGTTPVIEFTFKHVNVSDIVVIYLTISQSGDDLVERDLSTAIIGEKSVSWKLSQAETIQLVRTNKVDIQIRYRTTDGSAYASRIYTRDVGQILREGTV